jgi:ComF family protein
MDLVLPPRCTCCASFAEHGAPFCRECAASLEPLHARGASGDAPIFERGERNPGATRADERRRPAQGAATCASMHAPLRYTGAVAQAIQRLKFEDAAWVARPLASLIRPLVAALRGSVDVVVPVPLHVARLRARGYNQAALLARHAARRLVPVDHGALTRPRDTPAQRRLTRAQRLENLRGAFEAQPRRVHGRRILLVDDVLTTGATAAACALALRCAGAPEIHVLTLARAVP